MKHASFDHIDGTIPISMSFREGPFSSMNHLNILPASEEFYNLLISLANRLDPDQARQIVGPDLDPHSFALL